MVQIFTMKLLVEEYINKQKNLYVAFMDMEKAHDKEDTKALWEVLEIHGQGGRMLKAVKSFSTNSRDVRVEGEKVKVL